jgi:hypothetical protein
MPKREIDYSNTTIYKLICKDDTITETYIGHTTNFVQRKYTHKTACAKGWNASTTPADLIEIYSAILNQGGWENWDMIEIAKCVCNDKKDAVQKEREYRDRTQGSQRNDEEWENQTDLSVQEIVDSEDEQIVYVNAQDIQGQTSKYYCDACKYNTNNRTDFAKHELTAKHKTNTSMTVSCSLCDKIFQNRAALWKHKQCCAEVAVAEQDPSPETEYKLTGKESMKEILSEVIRQNNQQNAAFIENFTENFTEKFMEKFMEMSKQGPSSITNNTTNNNTVNNQFNLNVFLNEKCKNALNLVDFINTLHVQVSDLVNTGKVGFVEGITTILLNKLREVDVYKRPLHCTDIKREIVYVKNENTWEKESDDKTNMKRLVNIVARKNLAQLSRWAEENPEFLVLDTKAYNEYIQIGMNSTGGTVEQQDKNIEKVVSNVLKSVAIDKHQERLSND